MALATKKYLRIRTLGCHGITRTRQSVVGKFAKKSQTQNT